jgi:hypothetical protein
MVESRLLQFYKSSVDDKFEELLSQLTIAQYNYINSEVADREKLKSVITNLFNTPIFQSPIFKIDGVESEENPMNEEEKISAFDYHSEVRNNVFKTLDKQYYEMLFENEKKELKQNPQRPLPQNRSYDQVVKGNIKIVEIKNNSEYSHKITFHKIGKFLQYQVWDPKGTVQITYLPRYPDTETRAREFNEAKKYVEENPDKVVTVDYPINDDRDVKLITGKEWVLFFNSIPDFSPTTVMEIDYKKHVFVIKKAKINTNDKVVFYISTKEIQLDNKSEKMKKLKKIPLGKHKNVRFDIDYGQSITNVSCNGDNIFGMVPGGGTSSCFCPSGTSIFSLDTNWISRCVYDCPSGYYLNGNICSSACSGENEYSAGFACWKHHNCGFVWPFEHCDCPYIAFWKHTFPENTFNWNGSNGGYICNANGYLWSTNNSLSLGGDCPVNGASGPECFSTYNNNNYCCPPAGQSTCTNFN